MAKKASTGNEGRTLGDRSQTGAIQQGDFGEIVGNEDASDRMSMCIPFRPYTAHEKHQPISYNIVAWTKKYVSPFYRTSLAVICYLRVLTSQFGGIAIRIL